MARATWRYDERGNVIEVAYFGTDGQPSLRKDWGMARVTYRHDQRGNIVDRVHFGVDGQPILRRDWGAARIDLALRRARQRGGAELSRRRRAADRPQGLGRGAADRRVSTTAAARSSTPISASTGNRSCARTGAPRASRRSMTSADTAAVRPISASTGSRCCASTTARRAWRSATTSAATTSRRPISASTAAQSRTRSGARRAGPSATTSADFNVETTFFDRDGKPVLHKDLGLARFTTRYDARGNDDRDPIFRSRRAAHAQR